MSWFHWAGDADEPWRRLIKDSPVEAVDEDSGELVDIKPKQDDPNDIEGLLIGFRYTDAVGNKSKRIILCRRCWLVRADMYVQGFCTLREALRTFRVDQMTDVEEIRSGRNIINPLEYFERYADHEEDGSYTDRRTGFRTSASTETSLNSQGSSYFAPISSQQFQSWAVQKQRELRAREACLNGMRVLAYLVLADEMVTDQEINIEQSYIEARLAMCGFDRDERIVASLMEILRVLTVPSRSFARALNTVCEEPAHFRLVLDAATRIAETVEIISGAESKALQQILDTARRLGS